jgi:protein-S-isoprenylcysteine O-methyltransferase Ste14
MNVRRSHSVLLFALAMVFTGGLTFASIELPYIIDRYLIDTVTTPGFDSHANETSEFMAELFISRFHLRLIGYACFALTLALIAAGFLLRKSGLAAIGAVAFMLPVFAQFAGVMFFLAGLGILNLPWLPILDISFDMQKLGLIIRAPFDLAVWASRQVGVNAYWPLVYACIGGGLLIFLLGTFAWLRAKAGSENVARSWVYRISRHPQYLGWTLWTYGMFLLLMQGRYPKRTWGIDASLSWLLATMVIIGVAMIEELNMRQRFGEAYDAYRRKTPFLFPLPGFVSRLFSLPTRLLFKKEHPQKRHEVVVVLLLYAALSIGASAFFYGPGLDATVLLFSGTGEQRASMEALAVRIKETKNRRERYFLATRLATYGTPSLEFFLPMLKDNDAAVRIAAAEQMRKVPSSEAIPALIDALGDSLADVRGFALRALGTLKSPDAVAPMKNLVHDPVRWVRTEALRSLAEMGVTEAAQHAVEGLNHPDVWYRIDCIHVLGILRNPGTAPALESQLCDDNVRVRRAAVVALARIGSPASKGALKQAELDDDWEVQVYAGEALKRLGEETPRED